MLVLLKVWTSSLTEKKIALANNPSVSELSKFHQSKGFLSINDLIYFGALLKCPFMKTWETTIDFLDLNLEWDSFHLNLGITSQIIKVKYINGSYACVLSHFSHIWLFATPWTVDCQAPLSMGFQARILEWIAMSSLRESSWTRDQTLSSYVSCIGRWVLYP